MHHLLMHISISIIHARFPYYYIIEKKEQILGNILLGGVVETITGSMRLVRCAPAACRGRERRRQHDSTSPWCREEDASVDLLRGLVQKGIVEAGHDVERGGGGVASAGAVRGAWMWLTACCSPSGCPRR